jgi:hypothetical protein
MFRSPRGFYFKEQTNRVETIEPVFRFDLYGSAIRIEQIAAATQAFLIVFLMKILVTAG